MRVKPQKNSETLILRIGQSKKRLKQEEGMRWQARGGPPALLPPYLIFSVITCEPVTT